MDYIPKVTVFSTINQQRRVQEALEKMRAVRSVLQEQKVVWDNFHDTTGALANRIDILGDGIGADWHDAEALEKRIEDSRVVMNQIELAIQEGNIMVLSQLKARLQS